MKLFVRYTLFWFGVFFFSYLGLYFVNPSFFSEFYFFLRDKKETITAYQSPELTHSIFDSFRSIKELSPTKVEFMRQSISANSFLVNGHQKQFENELNLKVGDKFKVDSLNVGNQTLLYAIPKQLSRCREDSQKCQGLNKKDVDDLFFSGFTISLLPIESELAGFSVNNKDLNQIMSSRGLVFFHEKRLNLFLEVKNQFKFNIKNYRISHTEGISSVGIEESKILFLSFVEDKNMRAIGEIERKYTGEQLVFYAGSWTNNDHLVNLKLSENTLNDDVRVEIQETFF